MIDGNPMVVLVIAAHPDDESLGCGATIARLADEGVDLHIAFLADGVGARGTEATSISTERGARRTAANDACGILGARPPHFGDLPDNRLDTVPLLDIVQQVGALVEHHRPDTVFTHHTGDLNIDHRRVHQAVVTACRPQPRHPVRRLLFFEVPSSTEWQMPGSGASFQPNVFVDINNTLERKLNALRAYEHEMRPWPHARSIEAVEHLARWRGAAAGMAAAEAFMLGRELL